VRRSEVSSKREDFRRPDIEKKFAEGAGERGQRRGLFGKAVAGFSLPAFLSGGAPAGRAKSVAWVTRSFCAASPRRSSSWLAIRPPDTRRRI